MTCALLIAFVSVEDSFNGDNIENVETDPANDSCDVVSGEKGNKGVCDSPLAYKFYGSVNSLEGSSTPNAQKEGTDEGLKVKRLGIKFL